MEIVPRLGILWFFVFDMFQIEGGFIWCCWRLIEGSVANVCEHGEWLWNLIYIKPIIFMYIRLGEVKFEIAFQRM